MNDDTKAIIPLHIETVLEGREAEALERIIQVVNRNRPEKTPSQIALGLLRHILGSMKEQDNWVLGIASMRKEI